ncbi:hypothetical protein PG996_000750 [Apiospora saccharicola]|uniref:Uncharacterized protein n=1 Tax=Apiospora saccharicola TaxID=335842 RepID=A0ABR1WEL9_9PEZI
MADITEPTKGHEPMLAVTNLQEASRDIPLNGFTAYIIASHRPSHQRTENTHPSYCGHHEQRPQSKPKPAERSARPKHRPSNATHGGSKGAKKHVNVNQPQKERKTKRRGRHRRRRSGKESSQPPPPSTPPPKSGNARPPLPPDQVLAWQGNNLHRELDRILKNGRMMIWQQYIFTSAFRKIREALLELGSRDEKGEPITEKEHHARAYARDAFDRFKMCMEKV